MTSVRATPETLLAERDFVRALVRSLLRGGDGEDDVVQRTWLRALTSPPRDPGRARQWLGRIARNLVADDRRRTRHRERRERVAARTERVPSTAEVLEREAERRRVVDAVLGLAEPYRGVVLMRYWENRAPADIAAELGVPAATVRSRLSRGLRMLREKLDADPDRGWLALAGPAVLLSAKLKLGIAAGCVAVAALALWSVGVPGGGSAPAPAPIETGAPIQAALTDDAGEPRPVVRQPVAAARRFTVHGTVRVDGAPLPDTALKLRWLRGFHGGEVRAEHPVRTDGRGEFTWIGDPTEVASTVTLATDDATKYLFPSPARVLPHQDSATVDATVMLLDCALTGVVRDAAGAAVEGATIGFNGRLFTVESDADGRYRMNVGSGRDSRPLAVAAPGFSPQLVETDIPDGMSSCELDITLSPGATISGAVVDGAGDPVAGAAVSAGGVTFDVRSDADGRFVLDVRPRSNQLVYATVTGFPRAERFARAGATDVELVVEPGVDVAGVVLDEHGAGIPGVEVAVYRDSGGTLARGYTDDAGRVVLAAMPRGLHTARVSRRGFASATVEVGAGEFTVRLRPGRSARGRVVDSTGAPVAGASVYAEVGAGGRQRSVGTRADSDADGRFELRDLVPTECTVYAFHAGYVRGGVSVAPGAVDELVIRLQRAASVSGRVVDGRTGEPIREFAVRYSGQAIFPETKRFRADDGAFEFRPRRVVAGTTVELEVSAVGYAPMRSSAVAAVEPEPVEIGLVGGVTVSGVVAGPTGGVVGGALVKFMRASDRFDLLKRSPTMLTADDGTYRFDAVARGAYRLSVAAEGYPDLTRAIEVGSIPIIEDLRLVRGVSLRGRVVGFARPAGAKVAAYRAGELEVAAETTVRETGEFELPGLAAGAHTVYFRGPDNSMSRWRTVEIGEVDVDDFEFRARHGDASLVATVRGLDSGQAVLRSPDGKDTRFLRFSGGGVTFEGLAVGQYALQVEGEVDGDEVRGTATVTVEGASRAVVDVK